MELKVDLVRCIISSSHISDKEQKRHKLVLFFFLTETIQEGVIKVSKVGT